MDTVDYYADTAAGGWSTVVTAATAGSTNTSVASAIKPAAQAAAPATTKQVEARVEVARKQSEHHSRRLRILQDEQQKLVQLYYHGGVSEEVLQAEQQRIEAERTQARQWIKAATHEAKDVLEALDEALAIVGRCHETYLAADPMLRRMMNQAIFEGLHVRADDLEGKRQPVYGHLARLGRDCQGAAARRPRNGQGPRLLGGLGSNVDQMVRSRERRWNPASFLEDLMELVARQARRRALRAIKKAP